MAAVAAAEQRTLGQHMASRLAAAGCRQFFAVPGDYTLALLDELAKEPALLPRWCCSELGAGYAADGAARAEGLGCLCVTYTVGGLSAINAIAGAYAERVPIVVVTGGPNSNDYASNKVLHHTTGIHGDFMQELKAYKAVTVEQVVIKELSTARALIDRALGAALAHSRPVYICMACNLASLTHPSFASPGAPFIPPPRRSNPAAVTAAAQAAADFLNAKTKPVLIAFPGLRCHPGAAEAFVAAADAAGAPFAFQPAAKGLVPEPHCHPQSLGTYWGAISSPFCQEIVESADGCLLTGAVLSDYATMGDTLGLVEAKTVSADADGMVTIAGGAGGEVFTGVGLEEFLEALAPALHRGDRGMDIFRCFAGAQTPSEEIPSDADALLTTRELFRQLQGVLHALGPAATVVAETGDSVFNCQKLKLQDPGARYEWSQQYGAIGWSVGATLGLAAAAALEAEDTTREGGERGEERRVVAVIGDGSFQVTAVEVSPMLRYRLTPLIVVANNSSFTIESQIHDGPYNELKSWDYVGVVEAMDAGGGALLAARATSAGELATALDAVQGPDGRGKLCFVEAVVNKDDVSAELLQWGTRVSQANARPPHC